MMNIRYKIRVYSDRDIEYPEAYFQKTFGNYSQYWTPVSFDGPEMVVESSTIYTTPEDKIETLFDRITPELYESTSRSYTIV